MVTAALVLMSVLLVVLAGEAVRGTCRRMLGQPSAARQVAPAQQELAA
jgi:hypothetical protein